jgi:GAF domain-containing protein
MRRGGSESGEIWRGVLDVLWKEREYEPRLDAALAYVRALTDLPSCHLYLADADGRRLHLERSQGSAIAATVTRDPAEPFPADAEGMTGGAGTITSSPPLELELTAGEESERFVATPAGHLYSMPLRTNGTLVGLLQTGPTRKDSLPSRVQRRLDAVSFPLSILVQQARAEESLRRELATVSARAELGRKLQGSALELERFVSLLLTLALRATRTEAGFVAILDRDTGRWSVRVESGMPPNFSEEVDLSAESGLFDWVQVEGMALVLRDLESANRFGIRSMLAVPLLAGAEPLGIFALADLGKGAAFDEHSLELLEVFAEQVRLMLDNDRLFHTFSDRYLETVKGLAASLDARRPYTQGHHRKVTDIAVALARELGLPSNEVEAVEIAGEIHDVGLAGIAEGEDAYRADIEHPIVGAGLVEHLPLHPLVAEAVATHHEWLSGQGFPRGLEGDEIPLGGRILGVAELAVELTTGDPVRPAATPERLAEELERRSGNQFDSRVVDAALELLHRGELEL